MKKKHATFSFGFAAGTALLLVVISFSGCGATGSSNTTQPPPPTLSIALSAAPPTTLTAGQTVAIAATVTNDSTTGGVDWTCTPLATCGTFNPAHTASGATTSFTAPATAGNVTIMAEATANHAIVATAGVTVTASNTSVTISLTTPAPSTIQINGAATLNATVTNDTQNKGVDWTCTPAGSCGTFNPAHTASGANTQYTAPGAAGAVVITATATANTAAVVTANVTVNTTTTGGGGTLSSGTFAFFAHGETSGKVTYAVTGSVVMDGSGNVTGGEQDYVSVGGASSPQPSGDTILSGKLVTAASGISTLTLVTNNSAVGVAGTETFSMSIVNSKHALISEFDTGGTSSGSLDLQTLGAGGLAQLNGPYVWAVSGKNGSVEEAFGGILTADGAGNIHVTVDVNDNGSGEHGGSNVGTYTAPDAAGRGTMKVAGTSFVYYVVNGQVLRLATVDSGEPDVGSIYQGVSNVSVTTLHQTFVFTDTSNFSAGAAYSAAGEITFDGVGHVSGFADVNENGTATAAAFTGTYTVQSSGYSSITITPGNTQDVSALGLYLANPSINFADPNSTSTNGGALCGVIIDLDTKVVGAGLLIVPGSGNTAPSGTFAEQLQASNTNNELDAVGIATISGAAVTGTEALNELFGIGQNGSLTFTSTLTADTTNAGRYTTQLSLGTTPAQTVTLSIYQVDNTQLVAVETDKPQFGSGTLEQQGK